MWVYILKKKNPGIAIGLEIDKKRVQFAKEAYNLNLITIPIESHYWEDNFSESFDVITLWDVIEHVNHPVQMLSQCFRLLKSGGYLFLDTPIRNCFYDYISYIWYTMTLGQSSAFLKSKYSKSHLQIFHSNELLSLAKSLGFIVADFKIIHEMSFPYHFYFRRFTDNEIIQKVLGNSANMLFKLFRIKNKIICSFMKPY